MNQIGAWTACAATIAVILLGLGLTSCGSQPDSPRLVVLIAVDQLSIDYLNRFEHRYSGGLRWLLENGAFFPDGAYRHSSTSTGPGHATVATGLHPARHGIVGNSWHEAERGDVYCVADDRYEAVGGPGEGISPANLLADTLGDRLKARDPAARVYSFSTKDRTAVLMAGRAADGAFWYKPGCGCLVSSTYYGPSLPDWLAEFNAGQPSQPYAGRAWTRLVEDESLYLELAREDDFPTEGGGDDRVFPHQRPAADFESTLAATPFSDEITAGAAIAALRSGEIGTDGSPDLLALGLSATDSVGHRYGPFSQEAMDNHLRLDALLGKFLAVVDEEVGLDRVLIGLTADHGVVPLVEHLVAAGVDAKRKDMAPVWEAAAGKIAECGAGPPDETVRAHGGRSLYWNEAALAERGASVDAASECLAGWLRDQEDVEHVFTSAELQRGGLSGVAAYFGNSHMASRSPHIQIHLREYVHTGGPFGTGHGTAHGYDRAVPVLVAGFGVAPARHSGEAGPEDIVPTRAQILGLEPDLEQDTRVLSEALRNPR